MNTNTEVDRIVQDWLEDRVVEPRLDVLRDVISQVPTTPQTRARFLGRRFDRGGGVRRGTDAHDHPSDNNRRNRFMFSATGLVAAFAVLALSVSVVNTDPAPPGAAASTHTVAANGSGDFTTIGAAVDAASDGDTIMIKPGTYSEAVTIHRDITLAGDGAREDIVLIAPADGPTTDFGKILGPNKLDTYAVNLVDSDATLTGLTLTGPDTAIVVHAGAPTLAGLAFDKAGMEYTGAGGLAASHPALAITAGASPTVRGSTFSGGGNIYVSDLSEPHIEDNVLVGAEIFGSFGDDAVIRGNVLTGAGITSVDASSVLIEGNTIEGVEGAAIGEGPSPGNQMTVRGNTIRDSRVGVQVTRRSTTAVIDNEIIGGFIAVSLSDADATVEGNTISDVSSGIIVFGSGAPRLMDNTVDAVITGIDVGAGTSPTVDGNTVCGGASSIKVHGTATPTMGENTTCEAA